MEISLGSACVKREHGLTHITRILTGRCRARSRFTTHGTHVGSTGVEREHLLAHRIHIWADRRQARARVSTLCTHLGRQASNASTLKHSLDFAWLLCTFVCPLWASLGFPVFLLASLGLSGRLWAQVGLFRLAFLCFVCASLGLSGLLWCLGFRSFSHALLASLGITGHLWASLGLSCSFGILSLILSWRPWASLSFSGPLWVPWSELRGAARSAAPRSG